MSVVVKTSKLTEAGADLDGFQIPFTDDEDVLGNFDGVLRLKVATERVNP